MAKKFKDDESEEFRIRFIDVTVKGSSTTLQTAIRSVADAVGGRPVITRMSQPQALPASNGAADDGGADDKQPRLDFDDLDDIQEAELDNSKNESKVVDDSKPKRPRAVANPKPLDLDLASGEMPFEKFCQLKNPVTPNQKYLVIAQWFKQYRSIEKIKVNHVLTCFLGMKWDAPKDLRSSFRALVKTGLMKPYPDGLWEITYNGTGDVNKMGSHS